jgi:hypothetical protein
VREPFEIRPASRSTSNAPSSCTHCGAPAAKEALFKDGDAILIEKYCDDCLKKERFEAIMAFYERTMPRP